MMPRRVPPPNVSPEIRSGEPLHWPMSDQKPRRQLDSGSLLQLKGIRRLDTNSYCIGHSEYLLNKRVPTLLIKRDASVRVCGGSVMFQQLIKL